MSNAWSQHGLPRPTGRPRPRPPPGTRRVRHVDKKGPTPDAWLGFTVSSRMPCKTTTPYELTVTCQGLSSP